MSVNLRVLTKHEFDKLQEVQRRDAAFPTIFDLSQGVLEEAALTKLRAWMAEHSISPSLIAEGAPRETVTAAPPKSEKKKKTPPTPTPKAVPTPKPAPPAAAKSKTRVKPTPVEHDVDEEEEEELEEEEEEESETATENSRPAATMKRRTGKKETEIVPLSAEEQRLFIKSVRGTNSVIYLDLVVDNMLQPGLSGRVLTISKTDPPIMDVLVAKASGEWTQSRLTIPHTDRYGPGGRILVMNLRNSRAQFSELLNSLSTPARTFHPFEPLTWAELLRGDETAIHSFYSRMSEALQLRLNRCQDEVTFMESEGDASSKHEKRLLEVGLVANIEAYQKDLLHDREPSGVTLATIDLMLVRAFELKLVEANHHIDKKGRRFNVDRVKVLIKQQGLTLREAAAKLCEEHRRSEPQQQ